ncbi:MAG: DAK2 domain-containing protein, partial [Anaerolineales bacterium]|nr:DAK2 domain-containing protein [Anaerolineales bacterium]
STVAKVLSSNQSKLNAMDDYNHDHGDNMVNIFNAATKALSSSSGASISKSLANAAGQVAALPSGSAKTYAQGFTRAAQEFKGKKKLDANDAISLVTALMGSQKPEPQTAGADALGSLLGALTSSQPQQSSGAGDALGGLLGALTGDAPSGQGDDGIDAGDVAGMLLRGGMAFMQAKNTGDDPLSAGVQALLATSSVGDSSHRQESAALVTKGLLAALPALLNK